MHDTKRVNICGRGCNNTVVLLKASFIFISLIILVQLRIVDRLTHAIFNTAGRLLTKTDSTVRSEITFIRNPDLFTQFVLASDDYKCYASN